MIKARNVWIRRFVDLLHGSKSGSVVQRDVSDTLYTSSELEYEAAQGALKKPMVLPKGKGMLVMSAPMKLEDWQLIVDALRSHHTEAKLKGGEYYERYARVRSQVLLTCDMLRTAERIDFTQNVERGD